MQVKIFILGLFFSLALTLCGELQAQILFEDLHSTTPTMNGSIGKKSINMAPMQGMVKPSKPSAPMPHFKNSVIRPDRIMMSPIQRDNLRQGELKMNQITFNPMVKTNIKPQQIRNTMLLPPPPTMKKMSLPPPIEKPHWSFNPTLEGHVHATTRFDSSIRAPMRDYDSPYHPDVPPIKVMHPMAW